MTIEKRRKLYLFLLLSVTSGISVLALALPIIQRQPVAAIRSGEVAQQDILSPQNITYESVILTEMQRDAAAASVELVYTPPDPAIGRQQLEYLHATLAYITSVRADAFATGEQKTSDLAALEDIHLTQEQVTYILSLGDARWQAVQQEAVVVLEQALRNTIRVEQIQSARLSIRSKVSLSLPEEQAELVAALAAAFITPNSVLDETQTETARQSARASTPAVMRSFMAGEVVIQGGQVVTNADIEALVELNLVTPQDNRLDLAGAAVLSAVVMSFLSLYLLRQEKLLRHLRGLSIIAILFVVFLVAARIVIPDHTVVPYLFPLMGYSLTIAALFGAEPALVSTLPLAILVTYELPGALNLTLYYVVSSLFGVIVLRRAQRFIAFFWSGIAMALSGIAVVAAYRIPEGIDWIGMGTLAGASLVNGVASTSISVLLQFLLAAFLGKITALHLVELSRPDHPLLQYLMRHAPGTYQHSLQVASLAEQAAERIGADALLTRVGALYHDVGKAANPGFFIENQLAGELNPHHNLGPQLSAATIIRHIPDGIELARKHHVPRPVQAFISEHHGTMLTRYQYHKAVEAAGGDEVAVNKDFYRYPGPRPQSKETALLMLSDGCEARVRADRPRDEAEMRNLIRSVIDDRVASRELNDTNLTLKDLDTIVESFAASLRGIYHPRIQYPPVDAAAPAASPPPEPAAAERAPVTTPLPSKHRSAPKHRP